MANADNANNTDGKFRCSRNWILLTYSQSGGVFTREDLLRHLRGLRPTPSYLRIGEERHRSEGRHYHACIYYRRRPNIKSQFFFDFRGRHPNIRACDSPRGAYDYVGKEDPAPAEWGEKPTVIPGRSGRANGDTGKRRGEYIDLAREGKEKEAIEAFIEHHPRDYVLFKPRVEENLRALAPSGGEEVKFGLDRYDAQGFAWDKKTSLHLFGESNIGKTEYAKALTGGDYLFVTHYDDLKRYRGEKFIIFDDMQFRTTSREEVIALCDFDNKRSIHARYHAAHIPAGVARIFVSNYDDIWPMGPGGLDPAIRRRVTTYECKKGLIRGEVQAGASTQEDQQDLEGYVPGTPEQGDREESEAVAGSKEAQGDGGLLGPDDGRRSGGERSGRRKQLNEFLFIDLTDDENDRVF